MGCIGSTLWGAGHPMNFFFNLIKKKHQNVQVLPTPVKSETDQKEYKVIRLENGLTACLISDPAAFDDDYEHSNYGADESETIGKLSEGEDSVKEKKKIRHEKMAAAALCIDVGSFNEPKEIPGLAHLLEHMVFMGTKKFPQEFGFRSFIHGRCGLYGGYTKVDITNFYFACLRKDFYESFERFAQLFISPIMSRSSITKEREAIDYEFERNRHNDTDRRVQLLMNSSKKDSPVNTFPCGNSKTLRDNVKLPALHKTLIKFRKRHYSAHRMTLAIQAGLPIELLEAYVLDYFSDVPCNNLPPDDFSKFKDNVYDTPGWNRIYSLEPTENIEAIKITFALPSLIDKYKTKPLSYVSGILSDEGKGSLMSYLRKKVWALKIKITTENSEDENTFYHNSLYSFFSIYIQLTAKGLQNLFSVIEAVFSFINMMKTLGPQESIYNGMKQKEDISFRSADERSAYDNVKKMAKSMQAHPPEDYLTGPDLFHEYGPEDIKMVMGYLVPRNANIIVMAKSILIIQELKMKYDKTEEWYGTRYTDMTIPEEYLLAWEKAQPSDKFALPLTNQFITENFEIVSPISDADPKCPVNIFKNDVIELWHQKNEKVELPKAIWFIKLQPQYSLHTTKEKTMLMLLVKLLDLQVVEDAWPAKTAKLWYQLSIIQSAIQIKVNGLSEKLPILIDLLIKHLELFSCTLTDETFAAVKDHTVKTFNNKFLNPLHLAKHYSDQLEFYKHKVIPEITLEEMKTFAEQLLKQLYVTVFVQGNVSVKQASSVAQNILRNLHYKSIINENDHPKYQTQKTPHFRNVPSTIIGYSRALEDAEYNIKTHMILELIVLLIRGPLFHTLRTQEQLGYIVGCNHTMYDQMGILVYVQSQASKYSTRHVNERIDQFMKHRWNVLKNISESQFDQVKGHLIKKKQCQNYSLDEEASDNWAQIINKLYQFDGSKRKIEREVESIKKLKLGDLLDLWKECIFCEKRNKFTYRKLSVQVHGYGSKEDSYQRDR